MAERKGEKRREERKWGREGENAGQKRIKEGKSVPAGIFVATVRLAQAMASFTGELELELPA